MKPFPLPDAIHTDLKIIDNIVQQRVQSQPLVAEIVEQSAIKGDGVRLRAAIALLAARSGSYQIERVQHVASAVELIYTATRVHDELVDQAGRRRGSPTLQATWEHGVPLMIGDYMYALSAAEMALVPDPRAISYCSEAVKHFSEAMLTPVTAVQPFNEAERQYLFHIEGHTAALFQAASMAGCAVSGGTEAEIAAFGRYGRAFGLAFQIIRDAEDYGADTAAANGNSGRALRQGIITLPLIYAVAATGDQRLATALDNPPSDPSHLSWTRSQVRAHGIAPTLAIARRYCTDALEALDSVSNQSARQDLSGVVHACMP